MHATDALGVYANTCRRRAQGSINVQEMELSDLASVRTAAAALDEHCKVVDFLILNAGVAVRGCHTSADCTFARWTQSHTSVTPQKRVRFDCLQSSCRIYVSSEHLAEHFQMKCAGVTAVVHKRRFREPVWHQPRRAVCADAGAAAEAAAAGGRVDERMVLEHISVVF